jgi:hypothetical protein
MNKLLNNNSVLNVKDSWLIDSLEESVQDVIIMMLEATSAMDVEIWLMLLN